MKRQLIQVFTVLLSALLVVLPMLSGCGGKDGTQDDTSSGTAVRQYDDLPASFTYIVPYDDIQNDGGELGNYRVVNGEITTEVAKHSYCSDGEAIAKVYALIDTDEMTAEGEMTDDDRAEYDQWNENPAIHLVFDKLYFVSVYSNNKVITQTFYTEGEKYEQLADEYYRENGVYPPAISDGLWQYAASDSTYRELSAILLALPEEQEPTE